MERPRGGRGRVNPPALPDDSSSLFGESGPAADLDRGRQSLARRRARLTLVTLLFHKPYGVLSQFTPEPGSRWQTLAPFIDRKGVYAAGRLDADSEGLLLLTSNGPLQQRLTDPRWGHWRRYWVQVEGNATDEALERLRQGVLIQGRPTLPARARRLNEPALPEREPPIRDRRSIPTSWLELELREGRNRQVRRMTALVGLPTLRLVRTAIDLMDGAPLLDLQGLGPGQWRPVSEAEERRLGRLLQRRKPAGGGPSRSEVARHEDSQVSFNTTEDGRSWDPP